MVETARTLKPEQRVTVFYHVWSEPLTAAGAGSYIGELIQMCGGINIVSDAKERYPHISQEVLFARNPEVILAPTTEAEPVTVEWLRTRPGWNNLRAVRNNRIYLIDGDLISRCGPRLVDALEVMAKRFTPIVSAPPSIERLELALLERSRDREGSRDNAWFARGDFGCERSS